MSDTLRGRLTGYQLETATVAVRLQAQYAIPARRSDVRLRVQFPSFAVGRPYHQARDLAKALISEGPIPTGSEVDAYHIAVATVHGMDYLLTWNCSHIANAVMRPKIEEVCRAHGYEPPVICTPLELVED